MIYCFIFMGLKKIKKWCFCFFFFYLWWKFTWAQNVLQQRERKWSYRPVGALVNTSSVTLNYMGGFFLSVLSVKPGNLTVWRSETRPGTTTTTLVRFPLVSMRLSSDPAPPCQRHLWRISWLTEVSPLGPLRRVVSPPEHRHITGWIGRTMSH